MGRIGVTYKDVVEAAVRIRKNEENPTVDRVRQYLGTGSKSTIAPFLKRWRSEHQLDADAPQLPDELARAVKNIHEQIQQQADIKINEAQHIFDSAKKELELRIAERTAELDLSIDQNKGLEEACKKLDGQKQSLEKSLDAAHLSLSKSNTRCEAYESKIDELKRVVDDLTVEKRDIRQNFEHFQQETARDRQHERDHFIQLNQQLQEQLETENG
jgi:predicted AlkP superfamily phosphohydrolase/phosphomutase